eukprot:CAMPEP_0115007838 /NCGR_PEP_ID=MMETSP0216-20121206/21487_1 /TAXON_ID=223996 /ORGANISM="Protocruzia adherens, Strain Boccale" /LENGTH=844 /DNA_ID=CAMNT_0002374995 /DNA_START=193 /DNA_END=2727 /DNA_ORIENTATION=+
MFKGKWFGKKSENKYTLENLTRLVDDLQALREVNERIVPALVEDFRFLAELLVWGDKHSERFFELFCERNVLQTFAEILDFNESNHVNVQILQSLSILVNNISRPTSVYYILSNNHINYIISFPFDFSEEEISDYYISLLKALAIQQNDSRIQFFFSEKNHEFPLYSRALRFYNHDEGMVRTAVRTITLCIYKINEHKILKLILKPPFVNYFAHLACHSRSLWISLDEYLLKSNGSNNLRCQDLIADQIDTLYYIQDIFALDIPELNDAISNALLSYAILPVLVGSICATEVRPVINITLAIFLLLQIYHCINYKPLLNTISATLLCPKVKGNIVEYVKKMPEAPDSYSKLWSPYEDLSSAFLKMANLDLHARAESDQEPKKKTSISDENHDNPEVTNTITTEEEKEKLRVIDECTRLSRNLGIRIGSSEGSFHVEGSGPIRFGEDLDNMSASEFDEDKGLQENPFRPAFLIYLNSKDDNLIMLVCTLINKITSHQDVGQRVLQLSKVNPIVKRKTQNILHQLTEDSKGPSEEEPESSVINYDIDLVESLINLLSCDPPFRIATFKVICRLLTDFCYNRHLHKSLTEEHCTILNTRYAQCLEMVMKLFKNSFISDFFLQLFEDEWKQVSKKTYDVDNHINSLLMLQPISEDPNTNTPLQMRLPMNEIEEARQLIQIFFQFRRLRFLLLDSQQENKTKLDSYPLKPTRQRSGWREGECYEVHGKQLIFCYLVTKSAKLVKYIVEDEDYLIVIEPDHQRMHWARVCHKVRLRNVEFMIDRSDPRTLVVAIKSEGTSTFYDLVLTFEDHNRATYVKKVLEENRRNSKLYEMSLIESFLESCQNDLIF